ncbi:MAG: hypothetical protein Ct9H300mP14_05530 [Gammaproteobacteria bacterium]|nr:MAG: hypothetical protein Ct9H300mP14_05530 [Gammaproteobacteria bacterium]
MYFDNVKVPWERIFVYRDPEMCRRQFHDPPGHIYQNYQAQIRLTVKLKFLVGLARDIWRPLAQPRSLLYQTRWSDGSAGGSCGEHDDWDGGEGPTGG